jgi:hypothetical protein
MRKLDVSNYEVTRRNEQGQAVQIPYEVKGSLAEVLFSRDLQLRAVDLIRNDDLARKIHGATDGVLLLEEEEYVRLRQAIEAVKGLSIDDVPLVRRVLDAPVVEIKEAA